MKQVLARSGNIVVDDIPAPQAGAGAVLVRVARSCISAGTEGAGLGTATLIGRALMDPARVRELAHTVLDRGILGTAAAVQHGLATGHALGYSLAGRIQELGPGVTDLHVGQRVACAGAGHASHAEYAAVPRNLVVPVPDAVSLDDASTVALGSIALHGVRRLEPTLGETFVVMGLGLLGQLTVQLLRANGCRVIGTDIDAERLALARSLGADHVIAADEAVSAVHRLTGALGADGVVITAAGASDEIVSSAFRMCRPKGRVVVVGDVGLNLRRGDFYAREIEFRISTSYGPGRYDPRYEQQGLDYPIGYVRWTEARNMAEYVRLLADGRITLGPLIMGVHAVEDAPVAYAALGTRAAPIVLLAYAEDVDTAPAAVERSVPLRTTATGGGIGVALVGAGGFARAMHLPHIRELPELDLRAVVSRSGVTAAAAARQFGAARAGTDYRELLRADDVDAVVICTRHDLHASMTLDALRAGRHVLVEKPLALTSAELAEIEEFYAAVDRAGAAQPVLMTGYNRRFSEYARQLRAHLESRTGPAMLLYRMNAGYVPPDSWVHSAEGGGRNIGEACHVYDLFLYLIGARVTRVDAAAIRPAGAYGARDNFTATLHFEDGSLATLMYTALGTTKYAKERLEAFTDGTVAVLDDYRRLDFHGTHRPGLRARRQDKGHRAELAAFADGIRRGAWPIPLEQQLEASRISFLVEEQLAG